MHTSHKGHARENADISTRAPGDRNFIHSELGTFFEAWFPRTTFYFSDTQFYRISVEVQLFCFCFLTGDVYRYLKDWLGQIDSCLCMCMIIFPRVSYDTFLKVIYINSAIQVNAQISMEVSILNIDYNDVLELLFSVANLR